MKNVTLSASESLLDRARDCARKRKTTLNAMFREWLAGLASQEETEKRMAELHLRLRYVQAGRKFSREEMNAR